jgi:hypothetical protein
VKLIGISFSFDKFKQEVASAFNVTGKSIPIRRLTTTRDFLITTKV